MMAARVLAVERSAGRCAQRLAALGCVTVGVQELLRHVSSCVWRLAARRLRRRQCKISSIANKHSWMEFNISYRSFDWVFGDVVRIMKAPMIEQSKLTAAYTI